MLSSRPPLRLCPGNKLGSGSNEARNCKLSGEAQRADKASVFAGNAQGDESDKAESHARMGVMIPPLLWRVLFNPLCPCIHLQILLSPLICINTPCTVFNTDLSDSIWFPLYASGSHLALDPWVFLQTECMPLPMLILERCVFRSNWTLFVITGIKIPLNLLFCARGLSLSTP